MQTTDKSKKTALIWTVSILAALFLCGGIVNVVAKQQLKKALGNIPGAEVQIGKVNLSLLAGNIVLKDVTFSLKDTTNAGPDIEASVDAIKLKHVHWSRLFKGEAQADGLLIRKPVAQILLKAQKEQTPEKPDTASAQASFLKKVFLEKLQIEDGQIGMSSQADSTRVSAQKINVCVNELDLNLGENLFGYNDSTYCVSVDSLDYKDAMGLSRSQIGHLETTDAGPVLAQTLHLYNCVPPEQVAERMGKVASMWYDVQLDSVATSALNIPRMIKDKHVEIGDIHMVGKKATILQDDRYPPAVPYATLQEGLNTVEMPLTIKHIDAHLDAFTFIWETTHVNRGAFPMNNVFVTINSVSNAPGNVMELNMKTGRPNHGRLNLSVYTKNDKRESTWGTMKIHNLEAAKLDAFTRPLFGATVEANFHQIDCTFKGSKEEMHDTFCMTYDHLSAKAWDDKSAPVKFVAQNSGLATFMANLLLPKANPSAPGKEPKVVEYSFKRNPMAPYPAYLVQNLTNGMLHTMLPGGKVQLPKKK
jgi:hypothetical protein